MKTITKIEPQKKRKNRVSIFLDGIFFCGIPEGLLFKLDLFQGKVVDENEISSLIDAKLIEEAKQKVIRLFNRRMYSEKEIVEKLKRKGYDDTIVAAVVCHLKEISLIDDLAFAKAFVSDRLRLKPTGSFRIAYELRQKGIDQKIIDTVFQEEQVVEGDSKRALEIAKKRLASLCGVKDKKSKKRRLHNYLARRGFSFEIIRGIIEKLL